MQKMDAGTDDELRLLRARAYGLDADIHDDPAALERLLELEDAHGRRRHADDVEHETGEQFDAEGTGALISAGLIEPDEQESPRADPVDESDAAEPASRSGRGRRFAWAATVAASAAIAAGVTYALTSFAPVATSAGAPQIATLEPTMTVEVPPGWFGTTDTSAVFEYYGFTLFTSEEGYMSSGPGGSPSRCLLVVRSDLVPTAEEFDPSGWGFDGRLYSGCRVGSFPAAVVVPFDADTPSELTERYSGAVAAQFVLDGDRVGVFLDTQSIPE